MKCSQCKINNQSPGAEPLCGSCWAQDTSSTMTWPEYDVTTIAMLMTGKRCKYCHRQLVALPGDDQKADVCVNCV
jgi:hypothetical protein